jgi:hypothetical protein
MKLPKPLLRYLKSVFMAAILLLTAISVSHAQSIDCGQVDSSTNVLSFQFTSAFDKTSVSGATIIVRRLSDGKLVRHSAPRFNEGEDLPNSMDLTLDEALVAGELYAIYVTGLKFGDKTPKMLSSLEALKRCGKPEGGPNTPQGRDDANVYLSGMLTTSSGEALNGTLDAKLRRQVYVTDTLKNSDPAVISDVGLVFDFKASGDAKADPDSMNFGAEWEMEFTRARFKGPINYLFNYLYPKIESERDFDNTNLLLENRLKIGLKRPAPKPWAPVFSPFIGQELGKNLRSPLQEAEGNFLYRVKAGTLLNLYFEPGLENLKTIELDAEYTRRWPLRRELSFKEDKDKNLTLLEIGKRPRDYVRANLNFLFRDDFGATIGYEYGELPPSFKLVDHKLKVGLVFKTK